MKTEIKKPFTHGFKLTEQELLRINEIIMQQMRNETKEDIISFFVLKFRNGVRAEKASIDEVIAENNNNQWEIQVLKMGAYCKSRTQKARIEIEFRVPPPRGNVDDTQQPHSIYYYVLADDRNWVYLTSSQLDDRIAKIKVLPVKVYGMIAILVGIVSGTVLLTLPSASHPVIIPLGYQIISLLASGLTIIGGIAAIYGFPPYSFCWGDYMKKYSNRRTAGVYVINGVIIALVLSIIGGIIGTLFFLK